MFGIADAGSDFRPLEEAARSFASKRTEGEDPLLIGPFSPVGATAIDFRRLLLLEVGMLLLACVLMVQLTACHCEEVKNEFWEKSGAAISLLFLRRKGR